MERNTSANINNLLLINSNHKSWSIYNDNNITGRQRSQNMYYMKNSLHWSKKDEHLHGTVYFNKLLFMVFNHHK